MKVRLLSKRHRHVHHRVTCDCCHRDGLLAAFFASPQKKYGNDLVVGEGDRIDVCSGCLREALHIAIDGRKKVRP